MEIYVGKHAMLTEAESLYDAMYAELFGDRKNRVRNRRRNDRKHKLTPKMRKEQEEIRNINICNRFIGWTWTLLDDVKVAEQEQIARTDWEIEQENHADAMAEYHDYLLMAEDHEDKLEKLENITAPAEFWYLAADDVSREKIYERNRIDQMLGYARTIAENEAYLRKNEQVEIPARTYMRKLNDWLKYA